MAPPRLAVCPTQSQSMRSYDHNAPSVPSTLSKVGKPHKSVQPVTDTASHSCGQAAAGSDAQPTDPDKLFAGPRLSELLRKPSDRVGGAFRPQSVGRGRLPSLKILRQTAAPWPDELDLTSETLAQSPLVPIKRVCLDPGTAMLRGAPVTALADASVGNIVGINLLTQAHLARLTPTEFDALLEQLSCSQHTAHWHFHRWNSVLEQLSCSQHTAHWYFHRWNSVKHVGLLPWLRTHKISGVSALILHLIARQEPEMVSRILSAYPVEVVGQLATSLPELFGLSALRIICKNYLPLITTPQHSSKVVLPGDLLEAMSKMIAAFLSVRAQAEPRRIEAWIIALMEHLENCGFDPTSANLGVLAGVIFAGSLRYSAAINSRDTVRLHTITNVSLVLFATTTFIPDSHWVGATAVLSVLVGLALAQYWPVRNFSISSNKMLGKLKAQILNLAMFENLYDRPLMMHWIRVAEQCNGF